MSNLMKYRFQRKESEKLSSESSASQEISSEENSQSSVTSTSQTMEGTPQKQPVPQPNISVKRGAMVIESDSETDSPVKQAPSPWLNKSVGMSIANGHVSSTASSQSTAPSTPDKAGSSSTGSSQSSAPVTPAFSRSAGCAAFKEEERELYANLASLQELYPGVTRAKLVEALAMSSNDIDKAIDWIIHKQNEGETSNRKRTYNRIRTMSNDSDNSPDSPVQPAPKRARQLEYSESQESTESAATIGMSTEEKVQFLVEAFPNFPKDILVLTLQSKENNLEKASEALSSSGLFPNRNSRPYNNVKASEQEPEPPKLMPMVSPTENVGSIKAYQAARMARINSHTSNDSYDRSGSPPSVVSRPAASPRSNTSSPRVNGKSRSQRAVARDEMSNDIDDGDYSGQEYSGNSDSEQEDEPSNPVLGFFNSATLEELVAMDGCSKKKAENIMQLRPFESWVELEEKLESSGQLSSSLLNSCKQLIRMRGVVKTLMQKCEKIATNMEYIVSEITGKTTIDEIDQKKGYVTQQPKMLNQNMKLKPYQLVGLNWLNLMHRQHINGILGDEMGLGKTIQTIAFISQLVEEGDKGPHVIVVPSSTIDNWLREMHVWSPELQVLLYYGSQDERRQVKFALMEGEEECNVLLTTYNMASGTVEDRALFKKMAFHYAVFDEGHMLKNMGSIRYQSLMRINASRRLLLTGTPLQNNLVELMSLLAFVMPEMFSGKTDQIKKIFTSISSRTGYDIKGDYEKQTIGQAKSILKPFFLRRIKREVLQQLPSKVDVIEKVSMAFEQADLYDNLRNEFTAAIKEGKEDLSKKSKVGSGSTMLMQLRKAANHHLLHRKLYDATKLRQMAKLMVKEPTHINANVDYVFEDMEVMSDFELHKLCLQYKGIRKFQLDEEQIIDTGKFRYLDDLLPQCKEKGDRVLLFSQFTMMLDIVEDYLNARGYVFIRLDGQTPVTERQGLIDQYNEETDIFVFLLSTKAGGLGINLTAANVVVLHDIDFNPYNDKQAEDRCHRVGQTRDVTVYKLISKNTVEEAMLRCGQAKLQLEQDVTGIGAATEEETPSDVASLLKEALTIESAD